MEKKKYFPPKTEIIRFEAEDVIVTSVGCNQELPPVIVPEE